MRQKHQELVFVRAKRFPLTVGRSQIWRALRGASWDYHRKKRVPC